MVSKLWQLAHLALAVVSFLFLAVASVTGVILACHAVGKQVNSAQHVRYLDKVTLARSIPELTKKYAEISSISVSPDRVVTLEGLDGEGNQIKLNVDPITGKSLGVPGQDSAFIQWVTSLHRSLFLHEVGRLLIGIVTFLFLLILVSGIALVLYRQRGIKRFFSRTEKNSRSAYIHTVLGRILVIPLLVTAASGTFLFMKRFALIPEKNAVSIEYKHRSSASDLPVGEFPVFKQITLTDVERVEFPFMEDPEEYYTVKLKDRELKINQFNGETVSEVRYPYQVVMEILSLDLHTGRTNGWWALVLGIASLSILIFIWTGFMITIRRFRMVKKNTFKPEESEFVVLFGSRNGTTAFYATCIYQQLLVLGKQAFLAELNSYQAFPKARHLLVLTCTYGDGEAPSNASKFKQLLSACSQDHLVAFSVLGFGSKNFKKYCAYAIEVDQVLGSQGWAQRGLDLYTVNKCSSDELMLWVKAWSDKYLISLSTNPADYELHKFRKGQ